MTSSIQSASTSFRTSQPWTAADSAAGLVLRYVMPMRQQLTSWIGSEQLADECIRRLIAHLVAKGFGDHGKGRIRDYLMRGLRSAAKAAILEIPDAKRPMIDLSSWDTESTSWLENWRQGLLNRAWRSLERQEHKDLMKPLYTVLRMATEFPNDDPSMLAIRINTQSDIKVESNQVRELLGVARVAFSDALHLEVAATLDQADPASVRQEIEILGLASFCTTSKSE